MTGERNRETRCTCALVAIEAAWKTLAQITRAEELIIHRTNRREKLSAVSGARAVLRGCRRAASICLGFGVSLYCRFVPTDRNHADGPSRGGPLGVFSKERVEEPIRFGDWYTQGEELLGP